MYATAVREGRARPLERLIAECSMSMDPEGYAQSKALFSWLWSEGEMEAFLVGAKLEAFCAIMPGNGEKIPRGNRPDEAADRGVEPFEAD